jgi:hypothetical protein
MFMGLMTGYWLLFESYGFVNVRALSHERTSLSFVTVTVNSNKKSVFRMYIIFTFYMLLHVTKCIYKVSVSPSSVAYATTAV